MRRGIVALSAVLFAAFPGLAPTASADFDFVAECHDGQAPTHSVACDADGRADGTCTIGEHGGKTVTASLGSTVTWTSANGMVGSYTCLAAVPAGSGAKAAAEGSAPAPSRAASGEVPVYHPTSAHAVFLYPPPPGGLPMSSPSHSRSKRGAGAPVQQTRNAPAASSAGGLAGATKAYTSGLASGARKASATAGAFAGRKK